MKTPLKRSNSQSRDEICQNATRSRTPFQKNPSRSVFGSGRNAGLRPETSQENNKDKGYGKDEKNSSPLTMVRRSNP
ncbi:hypothetical protein TNCV_3071891 [Trichonephila clavipes]|nr:hypothetical protein TNCV_3071891 [Trichonephila clavipes]